MTNQQSELRFKEFEKQSYRSGSIGQFGTFYYGKGAPKFTVSVDGNNPVVRYGELYSTYEGLIEKVVSKTTVDKDKLKLSKGGEVLIPRVGERPLDFCLASYLPLKDVAIGEMISVYNTDENGQYFTYYIRGKLKIRFARLVEGGNVSNLYFRYLAEVDINLPSLPEQEKIADFLSTVDKKIKALIKKKELLESYKKGVMQQIFKQEIRFKKDDGSDYPEWEEKMLGSIVKFSKGKGISKSDIEIDGTNPCVRYGELYTHYGEVIEEIKSFTNIPKKGMVLSESNDVLIPSSGETNIDIATASCVMKDGVILGGDLNILKSKMNGIFLSFYMNNHLKFEIAKYGQGVSVVHLYSSHLKLLKLLVPSIEEQDDIANFLSSLDDKINVVVSQIEKMKEWKRGLLQQMFV